MLGAPPSSEKHLSEHGERDPPERQPLMQCERLPPRWLHRGVGFVRRCSVDGVSLSQPADRGRGEAAPRIVEVQLREQPLPGAQILPSRG